MALEGVRIRLNDFEEFDRIISNSLPDGGDLKFISKDDGTKSGNPIIMITFTIERDGKIERVQSVTTAKLFIATAKALEARHPGLML